MCDGPLGKFRVGDFVTFDDSLGRTVVYRIDDEQGGYTAFRPSGARRDSWNRVNWSLLTKARLATPAEIEKAGAKPKENRLGKFRVGDYVTSYEGRWIYHIDNEAGGYTCYQPNSGGPYDGGTYTQGAYDYWSHNSWRLATDDELAARGLKEKPRPLDQFKPGDIFTYHHPDYEFPFVYRYLAGGEVYILAGTEYGSEYVSRPERFFADKELVFLSRRQRERS